MQTTAFNLLDDSFLNIDRPQDPWSVHLEVHLSGRADAGRMADALRHAMQRHPMARARVAPYHAGSTRYLWEIPDVPDHVPLSEYHAADEAELQAHRNRLLGVRVPHSLSPVFMVYLVHAAAGDVLLINVNHVVADGLSTYRILQSMLRHYEGVADPIPDMDPLDTRDLKRLAGSRNTRERLERLALLAEHLVRSTTSPVRVQAGRAIGGAEAVPGYGCITRALNAEETARLMAHRVKPATVNDMVIAAMALAIRAWNRREGGAQGRVSTMMPVNLRPADWWFEVVGNYSSYVSVHLYEDAPDDLAGATAVIAEQTRRLKEAGASSILIDVLDVPRFLPAVLKARLRDITPTVGRNLVESTWVSNLGRLGHGLTAGDAGTVTALYFSPPAPMPMGVSVGVASMGDDMYLGLRYRTALLTSEEAEAFADLYKRTLLEGRAPQVA